MTITTDAIQRFIKWAREKFDNSTRKEEEIHRGFHQCRLNTMEGTCLQISSQHCNTHATTLRIGERPDSP